uniref:Uncharacterized protein n=1 Tax=Aegilops tauschii subsp. strangulata TaxID=200361 RepID=A0A453GU71_AEGTS
RWPPLDGGGGRPGRRRGRRRRHLPPRVRGLQPLHRRPLASAGGRRSPPRHGARRPRRPPRLPWEHPPGRRHPLPRHRPPPPRRERSPPAPGDHATAENSASPEASTGSKDSKALSSVDDKDGDEDDDWEAIADRGDETPVRPLVQEARVTTPCSSSEKSSTSSSGTKRRGRGSFLYDKSVLYSDQCGSERDLDDKRSDPARGGSKGHADEKDNKDAAKRFGTRHALVLYDFPPSTRTTDLERIFEKFGDHGVAIRWVNDSVALAVFRTPSSANEAQACVPPRYKVRSLKDNDDLLAKIDGTDLEPPTPRPKTSARTAQRLIAHGMGLKQFTTIDAGERKEQEEARRSRITARQAARDDAWG